MLLTIVTGVLYACLSVFLEHADIKFLLRIHQMSIIGIQRYYVPLLALYVLAMFVLGAILSIRRIQLVGFHVIPQVWTWRTIHSTSMVSKKRKKEEEEKEETNITGTQIMGSFILLLMAVSGAMYRIEKSWLNLGSTAHWWMDLHIGKFFATNPPFSTIGFQFYWPWYPLAIG